MKKRCLSLLLSLLILVSLCVSAAPSAAADDAEKVYVSKQKELLVRKEEKGHGLPSWVSPVPGRSLDKITEYEYDEFGNVTSETVSYVYLPYGVNDGDIAYTYDDQGQVLHAEFMETNWYGDETKHAYDYENGRICRIEQTGTEYYGLSETSVYEFNEQGFCTYYAYDQESIGSAEVRYEYDENGNLTFLAVSVNGGPEQTMTPIYEDGRQVATKHVAPDGGEVMEYFRYDEQGRLNLIEYDAEEIHRSEYLFIVDLPNEEFRYNEYKPGDQHVTIAMNYDDQDLITDAEWRTNGNYVSWTQYSYTIDKDNDNAIGYSIPDGAYGPYFWGGSLASTNWRDDHKYTTRDGNPSLEYLHELKILGANPRYVRTSINYEYETRDIKVEMSPAAAVTDNAQLSPENFYPDLAESYLGTPVPTPDGSKRLVRVVVEPSTTELPIIAELAYAEDGSFAGAFHSFDATGEYDVWKYHADAQSDDQGRLIYDRSGDFTYTYSYAEDGQSYTYNSKYGENDPYEHVISLADFQIPDLVKKPAGELTRGRTAEYDDEGLPLRIGVYFTKDEAGNLVEEIREYSYQWKTEDEVWYIENFGNTKNATVLKQIYEDSWGTREDLYLVFDDHGYLAAYYPLGTFNILFHYYYE